MRGLRSSELSRHALVALAAFVAGAACERKEAVEQPRSTSSAALIGVQTESSATEAALPPRPQAEAKQLERAADWGYQRCGNVECQTFPTGVAALNHLLDLDPRVIAVGEAHAQKGSERIKPTARRFGEELLPILIQRGAAQLVVELLIPATGCEQTVKKVREAQEPVVKPQAQTNQNDYVWLGHKTRELGAVPYVLEPSCEEYRGITQEPEDAVLRSLELIRNKALAKITGFVQRGPDAEPPRAAAAGGAGAVAQGLVVAYGGIIHNDVRPRPGREAWSFGPELMKLTGGKYVELDLIVPEYVKPTDTWKALPWYEHFQSLAAGEQVILYRMGPSAYTLILPRSPAVAPGESSKSEASGSPASSQVRAVPAPSLLPPPLPSL